MVMFDPSSQTASVVKNDQLEHARRNFAALHRATLPSTEIFNARERMTIRWGDQNPDEVIITQHDWQHETEDRALTIDKADVPAFLAAVKAFVDKGGA